MVLERFGIQGVRSVGLGIATLEWGLCRSYLWAVGLYRGHLGLGPRGCLGLRRLGFWVVGLVRFGVWGVWDMLPVTFLF